MSSISKEDVDKALDEIDRDGLPAVHRSTRYCLVERGRHYPPKYVLSRTNRLKSSEPGPRLHGGEPVNIYFKKLGMTVIEHKCRNDGLKITD